MNCDQVQSKMSAYYDRELATHEASELECHVQHCEACRQELKSYFNLSNYISNSSAALSHSPHTLPFESLVMKLDQAEPVVATERTVDHVFDAQPRGMVPTSLIWAATLAVAILLFIGIRYSSTPVPMADRSVEGIAIDYSRLIDGTSRPTQVAQSLSDQFDGKEMSVPEAEVALGFKPWAARQLPNQTRLVSTHVLKLPECHCENGKCTCGPKGCNCAVGRCQRSDGSEFLIVEHCKSQGVAFGDLPSHFAKSSTSDLRLFGRDKLLAASWVADNRQLTAIGLKDEREAELLASTP